MEICALKCVRLPLSRSRLVLSSLSVTKESKMINLIFDARYNLVSVSEEVMSLMASIQMWLQV